MIVRMAGAYTGLVPVPSYDHRLIISVHFRNRQPNGFPSSEEAGDLEALEMNVCGLLEMENESLCVLVVTNNGLKDVIFYTRNVDDLKRKVEDSRPYFGALQSSLRLNLIQNGMFTRRLVACWGIARLTRT